MENNRKNGLLLIGGITSILIIILMVLIGNVIMIGEKIANISVWLSYLFYFISGICFFWLIILPVIRVMATPKFNGIGSEDIKNLTPTQTSEYIMNLKKSVRLTKDEIWGLHAGSDRKAIIEQILNKRYEDMRRTTREAAIANFIITGVSQNGGLDFLASMRINFKMISDIVEALGKRPSLGQLFKLYISVLSTSLLIITIDDLLENFEFDDLLGEVGIVSGKLANAVIPSATNGLMNAFVTLRVGYTTIKYLEMGSKKFNSSIARKYAYKAARKELLGVGKDGVAKLEQTVSSAVAKEFS